MEDDFDWVGAQAACTAETMIPRLLAGVRRDVERRNGLANAFVTFEREEPRIHVHGDGVEVDFTAIVGITPGGICRYFVGEAEYAEWEGRKLALEQLFFEDPTE